MCNPGPGLWTAAPLMSRAAGDHTGLANDAHAALLTARLRHTSAGHHSPTAISLMGGSPRNYHSALPLYTSSARHQVAAEATALLHEARIKSLRSHATPGAAGMWGSPHERWGELLPSAPNSLSVARCGSNTGVGSMGSLFTGVYQGIRLGHSPIALRDIIRAQPALAQQQVRGLQAHYIWSCDSY